MNTNNPFALLGDEDGLLVTEPETKKKKNNQKGGQKGGQRGSNNNNSVAAQSAAQPPKPLTDAERRAKADKIFQQKNSLTDDQRRERNKAKKEKKNTVKSPQAQQQQKSNATANAAAGSKPGDAKKDDKSAQPAAPVKSAEQIKKEREDLRDQKVQSYLSAVNDALPGSTIFFKLNLHQLQKDSRQVVHDLSDRWKSSVDRVLSSDLFLAKFLAALPPSFNNRTAADIIPVGRYAMRNVPFGELPINLAALLAGPTDHGQRKSTDEVVSLVDGFLEGLFDHKPKVNPRAQLLNNDEDEDEDNEYVGSSGNVRSQSSFADFFVNLPESKKSTEGSSSSSSSSSSADVGSSSSGASAEETRKGGKGKEKEDAASPPAVEQKQGESEFGAGVVSAGQKDEHNPLSYLSGEMRQDAEKFRNLAKKIPRGWRFGYISSPIFAPSHAALKSGGGGGGRGGRGGNRGGAAGGRGDGGNNARYESGFMYSGNGLDHSYVLWRGAEMIFLFTTGRERIGAPVTQQPVVAAPVKEEKKVEEKKVDLNAIGANGKPAWKQPRKDL